MTHPRLRRLAAALLAAAVAVAALVAVAAPVAAEIPPPLPDNPVSGATSDPTPDWAPLDDLHLRATLGLPCVFVQSTAGPGTVRLTQKRAGRVIATASFDGTGGGATACVKPVRAGDRLVARRTGTAAVHGARVPEATLKLRLATNMATGAVWDDTDIVHVRAQDRTGGIATGAVAGGVAALTAGADRTTFSFSTAPVDLGHGDPVVASFVRGGDEWVLLGQTASVLVRAGSPTVIASGPPGSRMTVAVTTDTGAERGALVRKIPHRPFGSSGRLVGALKPDGATVEVGDVITATGLTGSFTVPDLGLTVDKAGNSADFTCPPGSTWMLSKDEDVRYQGVTADGPVHVDEVAWTTPIPTGRIIIAWCQLPSGFAVNQERVVP